MIFSQCVKKARLCSKSYLIVYMSITIVIKYRTRTFYQIRFYWIKRFLLIYNRDGVRFLMYKNKTMKIKPMYQHKIKKKKKHFYYKIQQTSISYICWMVDQLKPANQHICASFGRIGLHGLSEHAFNWENCAMEKC